jgi:hypothetical protein
LLATNPPLMPGLCQLSVSFSMNLLLAPGKHILRRDVADGTVQTEVAVMLDVRLNQMLRTG